MAYLPAYRLKLYRNFKALDARDFEGIVHFYEHNEEGINTLDFEEYFDCTLAYTEALFETGCYGQHIVMCDHMLQLVINENVDLWGGDALYHRILFRKASSLYQLGEYPKSEHILRELIKMEPGQSQCRRFLHICLLRQKPIWLINMRALAVALMLLSAVSVAVELFVVKPFFSSWYDTALVVHNVILGMGIITLLGGEITHWNRCWQNVRHFSVCAKKKRGR